MDAADQFVATARRLFETVPGSAAQRSANQWLIRFQKSADAWRVALDVLQRTTQHPPPADGAWHQPPTVLVVTMQLLRFKITHGWSEINEEQRGVVKQTVLAWLSEGNAASMSPPAIRVACVIAAHLVARMYAREWPLWHQELQQQLTSKQQSPEAIMQLLEIYGAIPAQLEACVTDPGDVAQLANAFRRDVVEIARVAREALGLGGSVCDSALRCIEHWGIGCMPSCPELGIDIALLVQSSLLPALLELGINGHEQAASEIVADVFMSTATDPLFLSPKITEAMVHTVAFLETSRQTLMSAHAQDDADAVRWQSLSHITSSIALHHAVAVFSPEAQELFNNLHHPSASQPPQSLPLVFLELVLACTSFPDPQVAQPTLEFWFFLLDSSIHQGVQQRLLSAAIAPDQLVGVLSRLVNALIERSRFPQRLVEAQTVPTAEGDDPDVDEIMGLRKEIADTMLSLFSKWPTSPTAERGVSCVKGMAEVLRSSNDVATLDAVLFLLEYTIELFDIDSSESEDDDEELEDNHGKHKIDSSAVQSSNEGAQLLQRILLDALELPNHPLLVVGVTRFYQSLSKSLVLPVAVYIRVARKLCSGLDMEVSYSTSAHVLLSVSKSIVQYTEIDERRELLEVVANKCQQLRTSAQAAGDLLEAAFRLTMDLSSSDFSAFCNAVLMPLTQRASSSDVHVAAESVSLLGRAIGGIQDPLVSLAVADQLWPVVSKAIIDHNASTNFRESALQYFSSAVVTNPSTPLARLQEVVAYSIQWLRLTTAPATAPPSASPTPTPNATFFSVAQEPSNATSIAILHCLSAVVTNPATHNANFLPVVDQIIEATLTVVAQRLHFEPSSDDAANRARLDQLFASAHTTDDLAPKVTELVGLLRAVLRFFAASLARETVLTTVLRLGWLLLDVDHQVQEICDGVCDFLLDACSSQSLLSCSPMVSDTLAAASPHLLRAVLAFFGPKRVHYKLRNLWHFLFQLLHAPRVAAPLKDHFRATLTNLLVTDRVLVPPLSPEQSASLADGLSRTTQRHRFTALLTQTGKQVEAMTPN